MIRQVRVEAKIQEVRVIIDKGEAMLSTGEVLGKARMGSGSADLKTVVWDQPSDTDCDIAIITQLELKTADNKNYYNNEHMVAFTQTEKAYSQTCHVTYWNTNIEGLFLLDTRSPNLARMNMDSINIYAHWQSQIDFLGSKISSPAKSAYTAATDPECLRLQIAPLHQTLQLPSHRFTRNLGDASVLFKCTPCTVKLANTTEEDDCYVQPPVVDKKGKRWYIDPSTRILLQAGAVTSCEDSSAPVLKAIKGQFYAISPTPREVFPTQSTGPKVEMGDGLEHGLYPQRVIEAWLSAAYIQHIHRSLTVGYSSNNGAQTPVYTMIGHLTDTYRKLKDGDMASILLGINWDKIGARCGLVATMALIVYLLYKMIVLIVRFVVAYDKKKTYRQIFKEARLAGMRGFFKKDNVEVQFDI